MVLHERSCRPHKLREEKDRYLVLLINGRKKLNLRHTKLYTI